VAEQLALDKRLAQTGTTEVEESAGVSRTVAMQDFTDQALAGTRLAQDHHVCRGRSGLTNHFQDRLDLGTRTVQLR
jgi:hypothetical protein